MVRVKHQENNNNNNNNDDIVKSQLANDTYNIYKNSRNNSSCIHINNIHSSSSFPFIDWYLILRVGEDASIATIRKQYHKLALLLHPDKNKHPKAEFSFKLISQAFECLSDNARRSSFHLQRWKNKCTKCNRSTQIEKPETSSPSPRKNSRTRETSHDYRALREQLKEDARVIENCMKLNRASKDDYPVFNPSNYSNIGYPHRRNHQFSYSKDANSWNVQKENVVFNFDQRRSRCENPVFELRTGCRNMNVNSACVTS